MQNGGNKPASTKQPATSTQTNTAPPTTATSTKGGCKSTPDTATQMKNPIACVETNMGTFEFVLYLDKAPISAKNFIDLAEKGFYDGLIFHRIIDGFVIQGGDPQGTGEGGPGYTIKGEFIPELKHDSAGIVAMARAEDPDSAGSQFYVTLAPLPRLDGKYAVFGKVFEGLDVVMAIGKVKTGPGDKPIDKVFMKKVTIIHPKPQ
ncbi:peptidylprolyl isomerase [Candidatus Acetothermia bacterium]|nr:peptidylprolyl isomerase [Candidatus Acetothermia bacterium]MBI3643413.1 peptidylprolyl isomerase [Candidatus Acetothermia bacterium]